MFASGFPLNLPAGRQACNSIVVTLVSINYLHTDCHFESFDCRSRQAKVRNLIIHQNYEIPLRASFGMTTPAPKEFHSLFRTMAF